MSPGKRVVVLVLLVVSCLIAYTSRPLTASATAGINSQISFTGKLVKSDNTNITDGTYNMEFKVYQDGTNTGVGSTLMWTEDYLVAGSTGMPSTGGVTFSSGTFSVNLGSICAFAGGTCGAKTNTGVDFNQNTLWVSVQIGNSTSCTVTSSTTSFNTACSGDGEMSPYIRLTAVPYAMNANLLSGVAVTALGQLGSNNTWTGTNTFNNTVTVGSGSATAFLIQDASSNAALAFDAGNSILKVYENVTTPTNYASISYASGAAIFAASSGNTQIGTGTGAGGDINLTLTGAADQLLTNKTVTLAANYSLNDFKFTRNLSTGAYAATGSVLTIEDISTIGAGSSAPNVLYVNQLNTSATGNLILARTGGGTNDKFKVDTNGTVTIASGQSYTSAGTLTLDSASASSLSIGTGANAHNTTIGNTTGSTAILIQAGTGNLQLTTQGTGTLGIGNNAVAQTIVVGNATGATALTLASGTGGLILQPITSNTTAFTLQDSASNKFLILDTTNSRLQVGDTTADGTGVLLVLDTKNTSGDPTGINGAMYYNSNAGKFRCYENGAWGNCLPSFLTITKQADQAATASSTTLINDTDLTFAMAANTAYVVNAWIPVDDSNTGADLKYSWTAPSGAILNLNDISYSTATANITCNVITAGQACTTTVNNADNIIIMQGVVRNGSTAGNFNFQFSQATSTAASFPVIKAGATLNYHRQ